jgi:RNA polymerase sigma-54 factor
MALETKIIQGTGLSQQQRTVITPQMRQAFEILQVSRGELEQLVAQEMSENPVLEEGVEAPDEEERPRTEERLEVNGADQEWPEGDHPQRETTAEVEPDNGLREVDWQEYLENWNNSWHGSSGTAADFDDERRPSLEATLTRSESLTDHLLWQLRMKDLDADDKAVASRLLGNMDEDGYLQLDVEEVAFQSGMDFEVVDRALKCIQDLDPPGVGARSLRECLLLQLRVLGEEQALVGAIVRDHLDLLEARRFDKIAKELSVPVEAVIEAAHDIARLEPKPGRNYGEGDVRYITPDVYVSKDGDEFVVTLNDEGLPRLRVSSYYRRVLGADGGTDAKRFINKKMRSAQWLISCIQRRQQTLLMVANSIVRFQRDFLDRGVDHLRPLVLKQVADDIKMHESTVSRATANKYMHTPQGIFELKYFFTSSVKGADDSDVSAESVKNRIRMIIGAEDDKRPLSDQKIAKMLKGEDIDIARRTVAKYREMMGILPSPKRRQMV